MLDDLGKVGKGIEDSAQSFLAFCIGPKIVGVGGLKLFFGLFEAP